MGCAAFIFFALLALVGGWFVAGRDPFLDRVGKDGRDQPWKNP